MNKKEKLSPHFTLGEMTKTSHRTADGNIPSHVAIENLCCLVVGWRCHRGAWLLLVWVLAVRPKGNRRKTVFDINN